MKHTAILTKAPHNTPTDSTPDGAVSGNGDIGMVWGGTASRQKIYISKADFWKAVPGNSGNGGIRVIGGLDLYFPCLRGKQYYVEQRMDEAETVGRFSSGDTDITVKTIVCAAENAVLTEITVSGNPTEFDINPWVQDGDESRVTLGTHEHVMWVHRRYDSQRFLFPSCAMLAMKQLDPVTDGDKTVYRYVTYVVTNHDTAAYKSIAIGNAAAADNDKYNYLYLCHKKWWDNFWSKSSVELFDEELELNWYASQYILACCARNPVFAPGLYGNFITGDEACWHGDLHLNYNYQAPFYAAVSSNHPELTDCYHKPLEDFVPDGKRFARECLNCPGIYFPVGIGPMGLNTSEWSGSDEFGQLFLGQKSNAVHAADIMVMRWYGTYDTDYARAHAYPYLRECARFWEKYLKYENGRYVIYDDAVHEVPYYLPKDKRDEEDMAYAHDFNNLLSLGLVRMLFKCLLDMSEELGLEEDKRAKWRHIIAHISDFPTFELNGKKVFRLTERGHEWNDSNSLCIQHIYPAAQIGFESPEDVLETARNTLCADDRRMDGNAFCSVFPCAARIGVNPDEITSSLKAHYRKFQFPNLMFNHGGGGIENNSTTASTLNEMLLQCRNGEIRLFPVWNTNKNAAFTNLRADGAFLVSAKLSGGKIEFCRVLSEKGKKLRLRLPCNAENFKIKLSANEIKVSGDIVELNTVCGDVLFIDDLQQ